MYKEKNQFILAHSFRNFSHSHLTLLLWACDGIITGVQGIGESKETEKMGLESPFLT
jgi:hypothetical protein